MSTHRSYYVNSHTEGGCETCGHGGEEVEDGIDEKLLWREIDTFSASFSDRIDPLRSAVMQVTEDKDESQT
jgi:hypothetical protein